MRLVRAPHVVRVLLSLAAVGAVTGVVYALNTIAPELSLGPLYLFAVVPVALLWGLPYAIATSLVSMMTFNLLFLPPLYSFSLADSENWVALAIYLVTAVVVSELAVRVRHRAAEAEARGREQAVLAEVAAALLAGGSVSAELDALASRVSQLLGVQQARIEIGPARAPAEGEVVYELRTGRDHVGSLVVRDATGGTPLIRRPFLGALASLIAVAVERERLAEEALEAEALRRSDSIKTAVLRAVSHDLQSPLTAIITSAETLTSSTLALEPVDREALLETIRGEAHRLERLVRDLLDLSRLQAGAAAPTPELWAIDEIVAQALSDLGPDTHRVDVLIPNDVPSVLADATQIRRALANVIDNALKYSPPDSQVIVAVSCMDDDVLIRVVDQGPGLTRAESERVFEPFYRAAAPGAPRGTGLGLAIVRGFVDANGGRAWVDTRPDEGCAFALSFPVVRTPLAVSS